MSKSRLFPLLLVCLLLLGVAASAFAQGAGSGTITGTVTDPTGALVPAAGVVVRNVDTGIERKTETSDGGVFVAAFLQPGHYEVRASKTGFSAVLRTGLLLQVGQTLSLDLAMAVQTAQQEVTVSGEPPVVDTEKTESSQVVSQGLVENLPIAGRRWDNFALLTPNVTTDGGSGLVSYRGISGLYNDNSVDGANNNQAFFSEARGRAVSGAYVYSMDSIKEYQVSSSNYSAELGQAAGGVVNAVTKSGANQTSRRPVLLPALPFAERARPHQQVAGHLQPADPPAAAVRRQRRRPDHQGQALLLRDLRRLAQGQPGHLYQQLEVPPGLPHSR